MREDLSHLMHDLNASLNSYSLLSLKIKTEIPHTHKVLLLSAKVLPVFKQIKNPQAFVYHHRVDKEVELSINPSLISDETNPAPPYTIMSLPSLLFEIFDCRLKTIFGMLTIGWAYSNFSSNALSVFLGCTLFTVFSKMRNTRIHFDRYNLKSFNLANLPEMVRYSADPVN